MQHIPYILTMRLAVALLTIPGVSPLILAVFYAILVSIVKDAIQPAPVQHVIKIIALSQALDLQAAV